VSSDKIEKNNKKIHTESSYAYFPILFHIRIFAVCCVSAAREKGVGEKDAHTRLTTLPGYTCIYFPIYVLLFFFFPRRRWKKKNITKISTAPKSITSNTNNRQRRNREVKLAVCCMYKNLSECLGELTKHTEKIRKR
jgi:hypothetical protein